MTTPPTGQRTADDFDRQAASLRLQLEELEFAVHAAGANLDDLLDRARHQAEAEQTSRAKLLTTSQAARELGLGLTTTKALVKSGALKSFLIGTRIRRIPADAVDEYIDKLMKEAN